MKMDFDADCESICWECASHFRPKRIGAGVALCLWCRIKEFILGILGGGEQK